MQKRILLAALLMALASGGCQVGEPGRPAFFIGSDSYPTRPGVTRSYHLLRSTNDQKTSEWDEDRTLLDVTKDVVHYRVTRDGASRDEYVVLHNDGLWLWEAPQAPTPGITGRPATGNATLVMPFPLVVSVVWDFNDPQIGLIHRDVERQEKVQTHAGTFNAIDIGETGDNGIKGTLWYVPKVGIVKWDIKYGTNPTNRFQQELTKLSEPPTK
jgi:hypothetical protein